MKRLSVIFVLTLCGSVLAYPGKLQSVFLSEANKLLDSNEWLKIQKLIDEGFCEKAYKEARTLCQPICDAIIKDKLLLLDSDIPDSSIKWDNLKDNIEYIWSEESQQRFGDKISLSKMLSALDHLNEIKAKIEDDSDLLLDLVKYRDVLLIPGAASKIYWWIEKLYWKNNFKKAKEGFDFLLLPENNDAFTVGASHFYLGRMAWQIPLRLLWYPDKRSAIDDAVFNLLKVHKYATCFTYIAYSYIFLAEIMYYKGYYKIAKAFSLVEVPTIDWMYFNSLRYLNAIKYCQADGDITNKIKHIQQHLSHCQDQDCKNDNKGFHNYDCDGELWAYCLSNRFTLHDRYMSINDCVYELHDSEYMDEIFEALTHTWPNIKQIPKEIAEKRVLNNNIVNSNYLTTNNFQL
jgi:hypothetical protein